MTVKSRIFNVANPPKKSEFRKAIQNGGRRAIKQRLVKRFSQQFLCGRGLGLNLLNNLRDVFGPTSPRIGHIVRLVRLNVDLSQTA